jgi:hypothetical protein
VSQAPQLKREWSLWPEIGWIRGNPARLSKGYFVTTYLSSYMPGHAVGLSQVRSPAIVDQIRIRD